MRQKHATGRPWRLASYDSMSQSKGRVHKVADGRRRDDAEAVGDDVEALGDDLGDVEAIPAARPITYLTHITHLIDLNRPICLKNIKTRQPNWDIYSIQYNVNK